MAALEFVAVFLLQSITHYGWPAALDDAISNTFMSTSLSGKLSLLSRALNAYKPDVPCIHVLLNEEQLSTIVNQLKKVSSSKSDFKSQYNAREILLITKAVTRIPANCSGLIEEGIEEVLGHLTEKNDEEVNKIVANITWQIAAASSESTDMNVFGREVDTKSEVGEFNCMPWTYLRQNDDA